ncbi:MAG: cytochrome C oxidase subunit IV family protein [Gemmatimonadaceae bacterium]
MAHDQHSHPAKAGADHPVAHHGVSGEEHAHPTWSTYWKVALILTVITAAEVSAYYIPAWESSRVYVPSMLLMSAVKFAIVVLFYMHLRYDHKLFRALFSGPLIIAVIAIVSLLFLFGQVAVRMGG